MAERQLEGLVQVTLDKIKELTGSETVVGEPIRVEGITILPVSKVTFGFAGGGSDFGAKTTKELFGGGSGAGVSVTPVAFLVIKDGNLRTVQLADPSSAVERALNLVPEMVDKLSDLLGKKNAGEAETAETAETAGQ